MEPNPFNAAGAATPDARAICGRLCAADPRDVPAILLVAAHPDDEVIGAGATLPRWRGLRLVHVTDGAPRDLRDAAKHGFTTRAAYAAARREELRAALSLAGVGPERAEAIGLVDQEASLHLEALVSALRRLLTARRPDVVLTHPYEGGHPDHDATAFAVHAACALLRDQGAAPPAIVEMTSYHARAARAPAPGAGSTAWEIAEFLPVTGCEPVTRWLSEAERALKRQLFGCYRTQQETLRAFPVDREQFRPAPAYDFSRPPHDGPLLYEQFPWGMSGERWRSLAADALRSLSLRGTPWR